MLSSVAAVAYTLELDEDLPALWQMAYVGPGWERVTGSERTTPGGMVQWLLAAVHPDDRVFVEQGYLQLARGSAIDRGFRLLLPDGVRHVHERARPRSDAAGRILADAILLDVTEARVTEELLSDAHDDLERVVQSIDEVLYRAELGVDGWWHTVWKGPGHARLLGLPPALLDDLEFFDEVWNSASTPTTATPTSPPGTGSGRTRRWRSLYRLVSHDGTVRWLADRASARRTPDGSVLADSITIDVTEHRRVTDELAAARAESERIAAAGEQRLAGLLQAADAGFAHLVVDGDRPRLRFSDASLAERLLGQPLPRGVELGTAVYGGARAGGARAPRPGRRRHRPVRRRDPRARARRRRCAASTSRAWRRGRTRSRRSSWSCAPPARIRASRRCSRPSTSRSTSSSWGRTESGAPAPAPASSGSCRSRAPTSVCWRWP